MKQKNIKNGNMMNWQDFIHSDPAVLSGKPIIKGTRLSVDFILGLLAKGWTTNTILENYLSHYYQKKLYAL